MFFDYFYSVKNIIHRHKITFVSGLAVLLVASVFSFTFYNTNNNKRVSEIKTASQLQIPENAEYEATVEEKEVTHFNIFTLLNKFIPN